jgi:hypothetical protein
VAITLGCDQAANLINRVAVQVGLDRSPDVYASTDPLFVQLRELLATAGEELNAEHDWTQFVKEHAFVTVEGQTAYDLPADYHQMINGSGWNRTQRLPLLGPLTSQEAQTIKAQLANIVLNLPFRLLGSQLVFPVAPSPGANVVFEYLSSNWVSSDGVALDKDEPTANDDWILYDPLLVISALKLAFLSARGFDAAAAQAAYDRRLEHAIVKNTGARTLRMGGAGIADRYLDRPGTPPSGFGS